MGQQERARCAFCGGPGASHEHVFGEWLKKLFPNSAKEKHVRISGRQRLAQSGKIVPSQITSIREGHAFTTTTRKICRKCNNGWMSKLEGEVAPILIPMIRDEPITLNAQAKLTLASWITKTVMTADTAEPNAMAITQAERTGLMETKRPPNQWQIWLARHSHTDGWETGLEHVAISLQRPPINEKMLQTKNTQATTIGIGKLLIHVTSSTLPGYKIDPPEDVLPSLTRLWPMPDTDIAWPTSHALRNEDVDRIAEYFHDRHENLVDPLILIRQGSLLSSDDPPYPGQGTGIPPSMGRGQWVIQNIIFITADEPDLGRPPTEGRIDTRVFVQTPSGVNAIRFAAAQIAAEMKIKTSELLKANKAGKLAVSWREMPPTPGDIRAMRFTFSFQGRWFAVSIGLSPP